MRSFDLFAALTSIEDPQQYGAQGWNISLEAEGGTIAAIEVDGIRVSVSFIADEGSPPIDFDLNLAKSFTHIASIATYQDDPSRKGAVSAIDLITGRGGRLKPTGTQKIARITVEARVPSTVILKYVDGYRSPWSRPIDNVITASGTSWIPETETCIVQLKPCGIEEGADCNSDGTPDDCELPGDDCNRNGIPDDCEPDCNADHIPDPCEILANLALDGDGDGILDSCEPDCDSNGIPDDRDISSGSSEDCNTNGIPDGCDTSSSFEFDPRMRLISVKPGYNVLPPVGDFNGDGRPDLVITGGNGLIVLFGGLSPYTIESESPFNVVSADFDGDGDLDLLAPWSQKGLLFLNDGRGNFSPPKEFPMGGGYTLTTGDFDGDGDIDIAQDRTSNKILIFLNDGSGTFTLSSSLPAGGGGTFLSAGFLNQDGYPDLISFTKYSTEIWVHLSAGKAEYDAPRSYAVGIGPRSAATGDLDGDGHQDLVVANSYTDDLSVFINRGDGTFGDERRVAVGEFPFPVAAVDMDRDEDLDLVTANYASKDITVLLNDGRGRFGTPRRFRLSGYPESLAVADFDRDGSPDMAVTFPIESLPIVGVGVAFTRSIPPRSEDRNSNGIPDGCEGGIQIPGDANQDGKLDISDPIWCLNYLFSGPPSRIPCDGLKSGAIAPGTLSLLDSNGDGRIDIADPVHLLAWSFLGGPPHVLGSRCTFILGCPEACLHQI